jgi:epoxyqueuosine reductase
VALTSEIIKSLARDAGFEIAGVTAALPLEHAFNRFQAWCEAGFAGEMNYLTDHRGDFRADPRHLLPTAQTIICLGKLYKTDTPATTNPTRGRIARYAAGTDYHETLRTAAGNLLRSIRLHHPAPFDSKICVDTAPLLERSYAQAAGLGWIGKNTCLINEQRGSWFLLAEILLSIPLTADAREPYRCGSCTRCIEACPTDAIQPSPGGGWHLDSKVCLSYLTIEKRGPIPASATQTNHIFGCDICQDVCPWNRRAPATSDPAFAAETAPYLADLAALTPDEFRRRFRHSPIWRAKYEGFLRNVAIALGNSENSAMKEPLEKLAAHTNDLVSATAKTALNHLEHTLAG